VKLLIENWRKFLTDISAEEIKWFGPGIAKLAMDPSALKRTQDKRVARKSWVDEDWIEENIGPWVGSGFSRTAFVIKNNPNLIFKVADGQVDDGRYTNGEEKKMFNKYPEFFPRVWMTSKDVGLSKHGIRRGEVGTDNTKQGKSDNLYLDWIIVDRVKPFDRSGGGMGAASEFIEKKIPILKKIIEQTPWRRSSYSGARGLPVNFVFRLFKFFLVSVEYKNPLHREGLGKLAPFLERKLSLKEVDNIIQNIYNIMIKDPKLIKVSEIIATTEMDANEFRPDNFATDAETGEKLIFLDINKFLHIHGSEKK